MNKSPVDRQCVIDGCTRKHNCRGWCRMHYMRWVRFGDPQLTLQAPNDATAEERLRFHGWTVTDSGCWEFGGYRTKQGYGQVTIKRKGIPAHRVAYEVWVGSIPEDHLVRHTCDNPPCINPQHLLSGTHQDNMQDKVDRKRQPNGEASPLARFTKQDILDMRVRYEQGERRSSIASHYECAWETVNNIVRRRTWVNV